MVPLPNGWTRERLGNLASFRNGLNFTRSSQGERLKVLGVANFLQHSVLQDLSDLATIEVEGQLDRNDLLEDGDLVFVRSNGSRALVGRCAMVFPGKERVSFSGFTIRARPTTTRVDVWFLLALARSELFRRELHEKGAGSYITNLSQELLEQVEFPLPPLSEQNRIAAVLRTWDAAISVSEALVAAKHTCRRAITRKLLADYMPAQKGPKVRDLLITEFTGAWSSVESKDGIPIIRGTDFTAEGAIKYHTAPRRQFNDDAIEDILLKPDDILLECSGGSEDQPVGRVVFCGSNQRAIPSNFVRVLRPGGISARFLYLLLREWYERKATIPFQTQTTGIRNLQHQDYLNLQFQPPTDDLQREIVAAISAADRNTAMSVKQAAALKSQQRGLIQKLLTGERRLGRSGAAEVAA